MLDFEVLAKEIRKNRKKNDTDLFTEVVYNMETMEDACKLDYDDYIRLLDKASTLFVTAHLRAQVQNELGDRLHGLRRVMKKRLL